MRGATRGAVLTLLLLGAAPGCSGGAFMKSRLMVLSNQSWDGFRAGMVLHSQDRYTIRVQVQQPAYVYVQQALRGGNLHSLWPPQGDAAQPIAAAQEVEIPGAGLTFQLDEKPGDEFLYIITALSPLSPAQVEGEIDAAIKAQGWTRSVNSKGPTNRGEADVVSAHLSKKRGSAVARVAFKHEAAPEPR